jgi:radical SAM protein with 4Fe4S-binding SPASM domain
MVKIQNKINVAGAGFAFALSSLLRKPFVSRMPVSAGIELTNLCNLKCPECSSGSGLMKREKGFMKEELYEKIVSEAGKYLFNINLYFQGEPMMHPAFFRFIELSGKTGITVATNGHFLSKENCSKLVRSGISKLIVSLDGMDSDTYTIYRVNGDFEKVVNGIKNVSEEIIKTGSSLELEIQFLVNRYNESQIPGVRKFAKQVHSSLKLKSMQVINPARTEAWMPADEKFRRYSKKTGGAFIRKNSLNNHCFRLWMNPVITWDGKVIPCCFDKDADYIMGDLNESSFMEIWHGEKFKTFRNSVLNDRKNMEICRNCTTGLKGVST